MKKISTYGAQTRTCRIPEALALASLGEGAQEIESDLIVTPDQPRLPLGNSVTANPWAIFLKVCAIIWRFRAGGVVVQARSKRRVPSILLPAAVLLLLIGIAYWNSFDAPLVFDDLLTIQANSAVQFGDDLRPSIWATRPILYLTFAINHALHGQQIWGYHLVNFILHFLNGILVFLIARHIFSRFTASETETRTCALLAAAFFVVHPVQTEAVTYVSSRSELLSTAFYGLAVLSFVKRDERKIGFLWSLIVAALFLVGLLAKETVISLPAVLLAYDFLFLSGASVRGILSRWRFYITFVAGGIVAGCCVCS